MPGRASPRRPKFFASTTRAVNMPTFRYRALTQTGEIVQRVDHGADRLRKSPPKSNISALSRSRPSTKRDGTHGSRLDFRFSQQAARRGRHDLHPRPCAACSRPARGIDDALELLAADTDIGRLRPVVGKTPRQYSRRRKLRRSARASSDLFPADVRRAGARRRGLRHARPYPRGARHRTAAHRGDAPQA